MVLTILLIDAAHNQMGYSLFNALRQNRTQKISLWTFIYFCAFGAKINERPKIFFGTRFPIIVGRVSISYSCT
jgi:hypothetical protein